MQRRVFLGTGLAGAAVHLLSRITGEDDGSALILGRLNDLRREMGLSGLHLQPSLTEMARRQVLHMHRLGKTTHAGPEGADPSARGGQAGYCGRILGEALAEGQEAPEAFLEAWLAHDATRAVLLDPLARDAGAFGSEDAAQTSRWALVLSA
jgi:uncharacterized protein YkwD